MNTYMSLCLTVDRCVYRAENFDTYRIYGGLTKPKDPCPTKISTISIHESEIKVH